MEVKIMRSIRICTIRTILSIIRLQIIPHEQCEDFKIEGEKMIELWNTRAKKSPEELFLDLAKDCVELGISTSDVYGDFSQTPETSYLRKFEKEISQFFGTEDVGGIENAFALLVSGF
jgi:hypothetical protein